MPMNIIDYLKENTQLQHTLLNSDLFDLLPCGLSITTDVSCETIIHNPVAAIFYEIEPYGIFSHSAKVPPRVTIYHNGEPLSVNDMPMQQAAWYGKETHNSVLEFVWENGISKTAYINAIPLYDQNKTIIGCISTLEDVSEIVNLNKTVKRHQEQLEDILFERTESLLASEKALIQANIELEQKVCERTFDLEEKNKLISEEIEKVRVTKDILRESEEKYRTLFNSIDDGFCIIEVIFDNQGIPEDIRYLETNPAFEKLLTLMDTHRDLIQDHTSEKNTMLTFLANTISTGKAGRFCCYINVLDRWFDIYALRLGEADTRQIALLVNDISERKMAEEMLREGKERALEMLEKLSQADENKTRFLNVLSHELRNPLASIMMSLSLLEKVPPTGEQALLARKVAQRQTAQLSRLVDNLLDVTRISQNKITLEKEHIELNEIIRNAVADYQLQFAEKGVDLIMNMTSAIYTEADPARLTQVIGNLLHNALKFTDKGDRTWVEVTQDKKRHEAIIKVKDTGIGIKPELLPGLFDAFMQADTSLDRNSGGLGLGLSIVQGIVKLHGGSITAYSDGPAQGTEFFLRLPIQKAGEERKASVYSASSGRPLNILVIDDIPDVAEILCSLLSYLGHKVRIALSGREGIAMAKEFHPEVLICDIGLPEMNGYKVAELFRSDHTLRNIFLIALSGYAQPEDLSRSREAGFDRHLAKPVDLDTLKSVLAEVIL
ncbi:ATP-binding protein [Dehalobacter sp. DCM]|uniref:ATP-binding response regulator n=1 Tax=Dehalobacter sp. DCM TaxID=2907827 RepID=UPI0030812C45|nr:ATP-binding protein [Dehalobacter sp. DCM]